MNLLTAAQNFRRIVALRLRHAVPALIVLSLAESIMPALPAQAATVPNFIVNGNFEKGNLGGWLIDGPASIMPNYYVPAQFGRYGARVGDYSNYGTASISQYFDAPAGATTLSLWYRTLISCGTSPDGSSYAGASLYLRDVNIQRAVSMILSCTDHGNFHQVTLPIVPGHRYLLLLKSTNQSSVSTAFVEYDNVTIQ